MLDAARALLVDEGLDALTMRALAGRLGVSPNALYSHVSDKAALVDALLDDVLAEVTPTDATDVPTAGAAPNDPLDDVGAVMASTYAVLLAHPDLVPLYLARQGARGPNAQRLGDVMLARLEHAGVTGARARQALDVLIVYTIGFAAFSTRAPALARDEESGPASTSFDDGLHWLLAGIAAQP